MYEKAILQEQKSRGSLLEIGSALEIILVFC